MVYNRIIILQNERKKDMKRTKVISFLATLALTLSASVTVGAFSDMPDGKMGEAMQNAVDAGLINGVTDDTIAPYDNITRAQMAAIITRAFAATDKGTETFNDVSSDKWYSDVVMQAANMGAFEGDENKNFNPENNITFQETYLVLSRVFGFMAYTPDRKQIKVGDCEDSVLDAFSDKGEIADWAYDGAKYIVGNGGWTGIDGRLKPTAYITRGEFALIMDEIVDMYIDEPGTYKDIKDKLVMVRTGGVVIDNLQSKKNLILTYGVGKNGCQVMNSVVNGVTLILGGQDDSLVEKKINGNTVLMPDDAYIKLIGKYYDVRIEASHIRVDAMEAQMQYIKGKPDSLINIRFM